MELSPANLESADTGEQSSSILYIAPFYSAGSFVIVPW